MIRDRVIAERAAEDLRGYWADRGYEVRVEIECNCLTTPKDGLPLYLIRADLINGLPKGFK